MEKTLQELVSEIYATSKDLTEEVISAKLSTPRDKINRALVNRWRHGVTLETGYLRTLRVIALHKRVMRRHNKLND